MGNVAELRGRREPRQEIQHQDEKKNGKETKCCHARTGTLNVAQASASE